MEAVANPTLSATVVRLTASGAVRGWWSCRVHAAKPQSEDVVLLAERPGGSGRSWSGGGSRGHDVPDAAKPQPGAVVLFVRLEHGESRGEGVGGKRSGAERDYSTRVPKTPHVWQTTRSSPC